MDYDRGLAERIKDVQASFDLNEWEEAFLVSILSQVESGRELSDKQMDKLVQIEDSEFNETIDWGDFPQW